MYGEHSRKIFFWFDFYWLSNGSSKIGHHFRKQSVSKNEVIKNFNKKKRSPKTERFKWKLHHFMLLVYKSLSKYVVKWVGCNRRCTFSISDFPSLWSAWNILDRGQTYFCMATFLHKTQSMNVILNLLVTVWHRDIVATFFIAKILKFKP